MPDFIHEPALVLTYGESGTGKTCDFCYSLPRALFVGPPTAFVPALTVCGYRPTQITTARDLDEVIQILVREGEKLEKTKKRDFDGVVVDDLTLLSDGQMGKFADAGLDSEKNKYAFWAACRSNLLSLRKAMAYAGMHVLCDAHERGSHVDTRKGFVRGGPALPGTMPTDMPKAFTTVLRVRSIPEDDTARGALGWPFVYVADEDDDQWVTKNRLGLYGRLPMNIGEMLRMFYGAGDEPFAVRRHSQLPWQEEVVEKIAAKLFDIPLDAPEHAILREQFFRQIQTKFSVNEKIALWTVRDGKHRAILRAMQKQSARKYV